MGYFDSLAFRVGEGLPEALIWTVIIGLCYGLVLGLLRLRTKNCYSTMLLHGAMNIFGR
ncbi:CPBP family intramembrane metalloprotease [Enterococcus hulanensis]|nr:CPBP family intramembrane metalloprotease [Enterococcus hulanensis]